MGHPYCLSGVVIKGKQIGRTLGFPTANIAVSEKTKLIPANGVYAVMITYNDQIYQGVLSIGHRPTFDNGEKSIEVNIFNFNEDIYSQSLIIELISLIRPDLKFQNPEALRQQMVKDKEAAIKQLS